MSAVQQSSYPTFYLCANLFLGHELLQQAWELDIDRNVLVSDKNLAFDWCAEETHSTDKREVHRIAVPLTVHVRYLHRSGGSACEQLICRVVDDLLRTFQSFIVVDGDTHELIRIYDGLPVRGFQPG